MHTRLLSLLTMVLFNLAAFSQHPAFTVIPLGVKGGQDEGNLSAYLVAAEGTADYICLDAGTLHAGIAKAVANGVLSPTVSTVLRHSIKDYFISHPHLDHVAGLILNSPEDSNKNIYALPSCLRVLQNNYFTWLSWANFGDQGEKPQLGKYHYVALEPGAEIVAQNTGLAIRAFPLSHGNPYESAAFLVRHDDASLLYLGDTGADTVEHAGRLRQLWQAVSPLIREGRLKAIFIEVSFPDEQPIGSLFGHLTPSLLRHELRALAGFTGPAALRDLPIVITHRKPGAGDQEERIRREVLASNPLQVRWIFPEQGRRLDL